MLPSFAFYFTTTSALYISILLILVTLLKHVIDAYRRDPRLVKFAETITGPPETSVFGSFSDFYYGGDSLTKLVEYSEKYGHMYKLWFGRHLVISLSKIVDVNAVFMSSKMLDKPDLFLNSFHNYWGDGLFTSSSEIWENNRKKLLPPFASNRFEQYTVHINDKINNAIRVVEKHVDGPEFNIKDYTPFLTCDIITKLMFNIDLSWNNELVKEFHHSIANAIRISYERMCLPWLHMPIVSNLFYMKKHKRTIKGLRRLPQMILNDKMNEIKDEISLHNAYHSLEVPTVEKKPNKLFLTHAYELLKDGYNNEIIHDEMISAIGGGTETTATMSAFFFLAVAIHQDIQMKLYDEIYEVFGDSDREADQKDVKRLSYLDQVLKETLRRFSLIPLILRHVQEDSKIGDRVFPAGTGIMIPIAAIHFDPEHYPNPWEFNPENFSPEAVERRPKYAFIPFSAGTRNCIGQNLSMLEMKLIITAFLRKFSFHTSITMNDITFTKTFAINCEKGYNVSIKYRIKKPSYMH